MARGGKHAKHASADHKGQGFYSHITRFYESNFRRLSVLLVVLAVFSAGSLVYNFIRTGDFIQRDVSLAGGISVTFHTGSEVDPDELQGAVMERFPDSSINVRLLEGAGDAGGVVVEDSNQEDEADLVAFVSERLGGLSSDDITTETMGSSLGSSFFREMFLAIFFSFIFMGIVFQFYFRSWYATFAALQSALLTIFIALGIIVALGVNLTSGGIAAFLMLIGYSIDTSILLSTKVVKERQKGKEGLHDAMKTGLTMSVSGIAAVFIAFLFTNNFVLKQIMLILVIGLVMNILTTWIGNVYILRLRYKDE